MTTTDESKPQSPESLLGPILDGLAQLQLTIMRQTLLDQLADPPDGDSRLTWFWRLLEPQVRHRIESRVERRIRESKMTERKTFDAFDAVDAPIKKQDGTEWVAKGASLSDAEKLSMMTFVEGVVGDLPK